MGIKSGWEKLKASPCGGRKRLQSITDLWLPKHGSIVVFEALYYLLLWIFLQGSGVLSLEISVFMYFFLFPHIGFTCWYVLCVLHTPGDTKIMCMTWYFCLVCGGPKFPPRSSVCILGPSCQPWQDRWTVESAITILVGGICQPAVVFCVHHAEQAGWNVLS